MAEVVLDANVIVALLYADDSQHARARRLLENLERTGHAVVLLDFLVYEALSVLCRRAVERKTTPPNLAAAVQSVRDWFEAGELRHAAREADRVLPRMLDVVSESSGSLNVNDALVVVLERDGLIERFATFDDRFDQVAGLKMIR